MRQVETEEMGRTPPGVAAPLGEGAVGGGSSSAQANNLVAPCSARYASPAATSSRPAPRWVRSGRTYTFRQPWPGSGLSWARCTWAVPMISPSSSATSGR